MFVKWKVFVLQLALLTGQVYPQNAVSKESSGEYLRQVMIELQQMKQPLATLPNYLQNNDVHFLAGKRHLNTNSNALRLSTQENNSQRQQTIFEPVDVGASTSQYYQIPGPVRLTNDSPKFTKNELASIYKQALDSGNTINVSSLKTVMAGGQLPTVIGNSNNQVGIGRQPTYAYYFYPLKSFMGDIKNNNGFSVMGDMQTDPTNEFHESQKQMVINPLFMALSSFLGMAIVFMLGVLIMPRLFPDFKSRFAHDELLDLTKTVTDAIETYNKTKTTIRPKTRYPETIIGIKTRPRNNTSVRKRTKLPNTFVSD